MELRQHGAKLAENTGLTQSNADLKRPGTGFSRFQARIRFGGVSCSKIENMVYKSIFRTALLLVIFPLFTFGQTLQKTWENLPGPDGGAVLQFETDGNRLYALTYGGIYGSQNDGETWVLLEGSRNVADFGAQLEVEAGVFYVLKGNGVLLRSLNNGATWKAVLQAPYPIDAPGGRPKGMMAIGDTLLVISALAIYRSANQGNTWQESLVPPFYFSQQFKSFARVGTDIFVAYDWTILKSTDGGQRWNTNFTAGYRFADMEAVDSVLYALYDGYPRLIRSTDHGLHWDKIDTDTIFFWPYYDETKDWLTGTGDQLFYASDYWCVHGGVQMFHSFNKGGDWHKSPRAGINFHYLNDLKALKPHLLAGTEQGVFRSGDNAATFQPYHHGMNGTWVYALSQLSTGSWWAETGQGIFSSGDDGQSWELRLPGALEAPCNGWDNQILFTKKRIIRKEYDLSYHVWVSEDVGDTWQEIPPTKPYWSPTILASDTILWLEEDNRLYKMADSEADFTEVLLPKQGNLGEMITGGNKISLFIDHDNYLSDDQGLTWILMELSTPGGLQPGWHLYMDEQALFSINFQSEGAILTYNFHEKVWKPYFPMIDGDTLNNWEFQFLKTAGGIRWISVRDRGLYYSSIQEPEILYPFSPHFPFKTPSALAFDLSGQEMWVGTNGAGIFKTKFQYNTEEDPSFRFGIYPNPSFGQSTLTAPTFITEKIFLRVFDTAGKLMKEQTLPPGQSWDIQLNLPAGMYLWQITAPEGVYTLKWLRNN